jgi:hypothetical protein
MFSIYHLFKNLVEQKESLLENQKLEDFPFDETLLSCKNTGQFPDMAIRLNSENEVLTGGELIELKDSQSYKVSSFNSTIPTGKKNIANILKGKKSKIRFQMQQAGNNIDSLPIRDVFYLIRGRNKGCVKVCLVHGSFFETIEIEQLIASSFEQILKERLEETGEIISSEVTEKLIDLLSIQGSFSKVRSVNQASVKLRFRVMTEVKAEGNILNTKQYPQIRDNTLNLVLPCDDSTDEATIATKIRLVFEEHELNKLNIFKIKHHFNGHFFVLQASF